MFQYIETLRIDMFQHVDTISIDMFQYTEQVGSFCEPLGWHVDINTRDSLNNSEILHLQRCKYVCDGAPHMFVGRSDFH